MSKGKTYFSARRFGAVAAVLSLFASVLHSHAQVTIVNSLGNTKAGQATVSGPAISFKVEDFSTLFSGSITSVILGLNFNATALANNPTVNIYIFDVTGTTPIDATKTLLGSITATTTGDHNYAVSLAGGYSLAAGQSYAIGLDETLASGTVAWDYSTYGSPNAGTGGAFLAAYNGATGGVSPWVVSSPTQQRFLDVVVVPEPTTSAFIGLGAVAFAAHLYRRKKASSQSNS